MNLNRFWPWKKFRRLESENAHKDHQMRMYREEIQSLEQQLGEHVKLNSEKDKHIRKLGTILAMSKGIAVLFLMVCMNCFAQPMERQLFTTNPPPLLSSVAGPFVTTNPIPTITFNGGSLTNVQFTNVTGAFDFLWTNDTAQKLFGLVSNPPLNASQFQFNSVANGGTGSTNISYLMQGTTYGRNGNGSVDLFTVGYTYGGTNKLPAGLVISVIPASGFQVNEANVYGTLNKVSTTNRPTSGWLYGGNGAVGLYGQSLSDPIGGGKGQNIGTLGLAQATQPAQAGVVAVSSCQVNNQTNIGVSGSVFVNAANFTGGTYVGGYYELETGFVDPSNLVSSVILADNRDSGFPIFTGRSNATQVAQIDSAGNAVFAQRAVATNGFASYATNIVTAIPNTGFTNDVTHGFGTNNMVVDIIAVGETVAFYNRSGANGQASCGTLLFTDTGIANKEYNVGVNCGVAFSVGTFTSGTARAF